MNTPLIFNIQKFSVHDGPGIRTTIFFKGCPMRCLWCHNPESQKPGQEKMEDSHEKTELVGTCYTVEELVRMVQKDEIFYDQSGGGVTLSGGEVMIQDMDYILRLLKSFRSKGISVAIDTCGYAPAENFKLVLPYTDLFLYDLKMIDTQNHERCTGVPLEPVLENLKLLSDHQAAVDLRLIMIKDLNMDEGSIRKILDWLKAEHVMPQKISLLPYHDFGRDKYRKLGRTCTQNFKKPSDEELKKVQDIFERNGYPAFIGG